MQIRFSSCRGLEITDKSGILLGMVLSPLINPDTGKVLGFFCVPVDCVSFRKTVFLSALDIVHFGTRVTVRDIDVLCDPSEIIRLKNALEDLRKFLGQKIKTENDVYIGICADIQFDTGSMQIEWIFPKKFFRWKDPISVKRILEVTNDSVIVSDNNVEPVKTLEEKAANVLENAVPRIPEAG